MIDQLCRTAKTSLCPRGCSIPWSAQKAGVWLTAGWLKYPYIIVRINASPSSKRYDVYGRNNAHFSQSYGCTSRCSKADCWRLLARGPAPRARPTTNRSFASATSRLQTTTNISTTDGRRNGGPTQFILGNLLLLQVHSSPTSTRVTLYRSRSVPNTNPQDLIEAVLRVVYPLTER